MGMKNIVQTEWLDINNFTIKSSHFLENIWVTEWPLAILEFIWNILTTI